MEDLDIGILNTDLVGANGEKDPFIDRKDADVGGLIDKMTETQA